MAVKPLLKKTKKENRGNKSIWFTGRVNIVVGNGRRMCKGTLEANKVVWNI